MRIKDIEGYKGNNDGFAKLYAEIWKKAIKDEFGHQMTRLLLDTSSKLFSALLKYDKKERNTYAKVSRLVGLEYGAQGMQLMQKLEMLIDESKDAIKKAVQFKVYREAEAWPKNKRKCPEYEKAYTQIREGVLIMLAEVGDYKKPIMSCTEQAAQTALALLKDGEVEG